MEDIGIVVIAVVGGGADGIDEFEILLLEGIVYCEFAC